MVRHRRGAVAWVASLPIALAMIACTPSQPRCISTDDLVLDHVFEQVPDGVAIDGSGTPGPDSDGFFYVAIRFQIAQSARVGVWGYSAENDVYAIDSVAAETSGWPVLDTEEDDMQAFSKRALSCLDAQT